MPIMHSPTAKLPDRHTAFFRDLRGGRRRKSFKSLSAAEHHLVLNAGPKSRQDLLTISTATTVAWFIRAQRGRGVIKASCVAQASILRRFLVEPFGTRVFSTLQTEHYNTVHKGLLGFGGYTTNTVRLYMNLLDQLANDAWLAGFARSNPCRVAMLGVAAAERVEFDLHHPDEEDLALLGWHAWPCSGAMVGLMAEAGARLRELPEARWPDMDFDRRRLALRGTEAVNDRSVDDRDTKPSGDAAKEVAVRTLDMSPRLAACLLRWRFVSRGFPGDFLFPTYDGRKNSRAAVCLVDAAQRRAGLVRADDEMAGRGWTKPRKEGRPSRVMYTPVAFRHAAALRMASGHDIKEVASWLGVTSATVIELYGGRYDDREAEAYLESCDDSVGPAGSDGENRGAQR